MKNEIILFIYLFFEKKSKSFCKSHNNKKKKKTSHILNKYNKLSMLALYNDILLRFLVFVHRGML